MTENVKTLLRFAVITIMVFAGTCAVSYGDTAEQAANAAASKKEAIQLLVDRAESTLGHFRDDPNLPAFRDQIKRAKGVFVAPRIVRAGFIFAGTGGPGVFMAKQEQSGAWSAPAFYSTGGASVGLQVGGEKAEMVFLLMTQKAIDSLMATSLKLGADASVAAGRAGVGARTQMADIIAYSKAKGFYGGVSVEGLVLRTRDDVNGLYYGKGVRTLDIIERRTATNPRADGLVGLVAKMAQD